MLKTSCSQQDFSFHYVTRLRFLLLLRWLTSTPWSLLHAAS